MFKIRLPAIIVTTLAVTAVTCQCHAQPRDFFITNADEAWVVARDQTLPVPDSGDVIAVMIRVSPKGPGNRVNARVFTFISVAGNRYNVDDMEELTTANTTLSGQVAVVGSGQNARYELTLSEPALPNVTVYLTGVWLRGAQPAKKLVLCRMKFTQPLHCEIPPTEDVSQKEEFIDAGNDGVPDVGPLSTP